MSNKLSELMKREDRGARLAQNLLTRAFRDMLVAIEMTEEWLNTLIEVYLRSPDRQIDSETRADPVKYANKLANDRGNLKKEIEKDEYTFKVYMKLLEMCRPKEFSITFSGTWHDGRKFHGTYQDILNDHEFDPELDKVFGQVQKVLDEIPKLSPSEQQSFAQEIDRYRTSVSEDLEKRQVENDSDIEDADYKEIN